MSEDDKVKLTDRAIPVNVFKYVDGPDGQKILWPPMVRATTITNNDVQEKVVFKDVE